MTSFSKCLAERLNDIPLFASLEARDRQALAKLLQERRHQPRETVLIQGEPTTELILLEEGSLRVLAAGAAERDVTLAVVTPGAFFGDLGLLDGQPRPVSAVAVTECLLLVLTHARFVEFLAGHPEAAARMLAFMARRLRRADGQIRDLSLLSTRQRLAALLRDLALQTGEVGSHGVLLPREINQKALAEMLDTSREAVHRETAALRTRRLVEKEGRRIRVLDPDGLRAVVKGA